MNKLANFFNVLKNVCSNDEQILNQTQNKNLQLSKLQSPWHFFPYWGKKVEFDAAVINKEYIIEGIIGTGTTTKVFWKQITLLQKKHGKFLWMKTNVVKCKDKDGRIQEFTLRGKGDYLLMEE